MTTKHKIIVGFVLMIVLIAGIAILGYTSLQNTSHSFKRFRDLAQINISVSDVATSLNGAVAGTYEFLLDDNLTSLESAYKFSDDALMQLEASKNFAVLSGQLVILEDIAQKLQSLKGAQAQIEKNFLDMQTHYSTVVAPVGMAMLGALEEITNICMQTGNMDALHMASLTTNNYANMLAWLGSFSESRADSDARRVGEFMLAVDASMAKLKAALPSALGQKYFATLADSYQAIKNGFADMTKLAAQVNNSFDTMIAIQQDVDSIVTKFNQQVDSEMAEFVALSLDENEATQYSMLIIGVIGILIGVASALLIIFGIIRTLSKLSAFATEIARGNFDNDPNIREKGEIGAMVAGLQRIPFLLNEVVAKGRELSSKVSRGHFRAEFEGDGYEGGFKSLADAINNISHSFASILDVLPVSLMAANTDRKIIFLNSLAQDIAHGNRIGEFCGDTLKSEACQQKSTCLGIACMENKENAESDLVIDTPSGTVHLNTITVPLLDSSSNVLGIIEITNDITGIKNAQQLMQDVAHQASEISDRVAAASEELSAQVEQVSRGAEMQRERVESTASAMTEMNSTVLEVARNAGQAAEQSEGTRQNAESGAELVGQVVRAINTVNAIAAKLQANMTELGTQATNIGGVMNVISDIADQTNLLALNAAIEAARAGEAGRGFAVVADEVRKLAEKTMEATHEVGASIAAIQQSAHTNISEMEQAASSINQATSLANSSGEALNEIVNLVVGTSEVVASIATAAEQQSATSEEITRAIDDINTVVGETTEGMVQSSAAVQDLSRMAQELNNILSQLK